MQVLPVTNPVTARQSLSALNYPVVYTGTDTVTFAGKPGRAQKIGLLGTLLAALGITAVSCTAGGKNTVEIKGWPIGEPIAEVKDNGSVYDRGFVFRSFQQIGSVDEKGNAKTGTEWDLLRYTFCHGEADGDIIKHGLAPLPGPNYRVGRVDTDGTVRDIFGIPKGKIEDPDNLLTRAEEAGAACLVFFNDTKDNNNDDSPANSQNE